MYVRAGKLVDPMSATVRSDQLLLIKDGRIAALGPYAPPPKGAVVTDWSAYTVLPGLIDMIVPAVKAAEATNPKNLLAASITENVRNTVRGFSTSQPVLAPKVASGALKVVGAVYDVGTGKITMT